MPLGPGIQHFSIYLPSPTTVSFTVSTLPLYDPAAQGNTTNRLSHLWLTKIHVFRVLKYIARIVLVFYTLLINFTKAQTLAHSPRLDAYVDLWLGLSPFDRVVKVLAEKAEWWLLVPLSLAIVYACLRRDYVEESLLVLQGLGIQTSTSSQYFFTGATTTFIPTTQIQDIVIHEAFKGLEVRYYLAVIVQGAAEVVVVFPVRTHL